MTRRLITDQLLPRFCYRVNQDMHIGVLNTDEAGACHASTLASEYTRS